jgi:hypothetical protein
LRQRLPSYAAAYRGGLFDGKGTLCELPCFSPDTSMVSQLEQSIHPEWRRDSPAAQ